MKIVRVLNNNVVLATRDDGGEVVLTGWGLGFGKKAGQPVDKSKVKQVFVPEHGRNVDNMGRLLASLNLDYVDLATHLVDSVAGSLVPHPESATVIALADHIQMSVKRQGLAAEHTNGGHPLEAEVRNLYTDEYHVAERMLTETNGWLARR
ncbi:MAG: CAT RNA binding domain-containing protein, partial [Corynebacterium kroppenstedtii]|nr:CAT RNA binding domain-containing protein [Corynebacterium kroppenstedtii]